MTNETNRAPAAPDNIQKLARALVATYDDPHLSAVAVERSVGMLRRALEAAPVPASTGWASISDIEGLPDLIEKWAASRPGRDARAAWNRIAERVDSYFAARPPAPAARELDADAEHRACLAEYRSRYLIPAQVPGEMITESVQFKCEFAGWCAARATAESAHGYVNGWNDCVDQFASQCASQCTTENATVANRVCSGSGTAESAPASAAPTCPIPGRQCACRACNPHMVGSMMFICPACGDKRCPNAADHRAGCPERAPSNSPVGAKEQE